LVLVAEGDRVFFIFTIVGKDVGWCVVGIFVGEVIETEVGVCQGTIEGVCVGDSEEFAQLPIRGSISELESPFESVPVSLWEPGPALDSVVGVVETTDGAWEGQRDGTIHDSDGAFDGGTVGGSVEVVGARVSKTMISGSGDAEGDIVWSVKDGAIEGDPFHLLLGESVSVCVGAIDSGVVDLGGVDVVEFSSSTSLGKRDGTTGEIEGEKVRRNICGDGARFVGWLVGWLVGCDDTICIGEVNRIAAVMLCPNKLRESNPPTNLR
jgi:hypothetical protein